MALARPRKKRAGHYVRRLSGALAAAVTMVALMGCGVVAAAVIYGDSIQSWFSHSWVTSTHQPMSEGQTAIIDHLTQEIGMTQTAGGLTITLDSASIGNNGCLLLFRGYGVNFDQMDIFPDVSGIESYGLQFGGLDGDEAALLLVDMTYDKEGADSPLDVKLTLRNRYAMAERWEFSFTLDRSQLPEVVRLPDAQVSNALISDIQLTNTGVSFRCEAGIPYEDRLPRLILAGGIEVEVNNGIGQLEGQYFYNWLVPVDLNEAAALYIGKTEIPIP